MTLSNSPSIREFVITIIISTIIPLISIYSISKEWKAKNQFLRAIITIAIFFVLFVITAIAMLYLFSFIGY